MSSHSNTLTHKSNRANLALVEAKKASSGIFFFCNYFFRSNNFECFSDVQTAAFHLDTPLGNRQWSLTDPTVHYGMAILGSVYERERERKKSSVFIVSILKPVTLKCFRPCKSIDSFVFLKGTRLKFSRVQR